MKLTTVDDVYCWALKNGFKLWLNAQTECCVCYTRTWQTGFEIFPQHLDQELQDLQGEHLPCTLDHKLVPGTQCSGVENLVAFGVGIAGHPEWGRVTEMLVSGAQPSGEVEIPEDPIVKIRQSACRHTQRTGEVVPSVCKTCNSSCEHAGHMDNA